MTPRWTTPDVRYKANVFRFRSPSPSFPLGYWSSGGLKQFAGRGNLYRSDVDHISVIATAVVLISQRRDGGGCRVTYGLRWR
jgi:hypothetical protein